MLRLSFKAGRCCCALCTGLGIPILSTEGGLLLFRIFVSQLSGFFSRERETGRVYVLRSRAGDVYIRRINGHALFRYIHHLVCIFQTSAAFALYNFALYFVFLHLGW